MRIPRRAVVAATVAAFASSAAAPAHAQKYATAKGQTKPVYTESIVEEFRVPTAYGQLYGWVRRPVTPPGTRVPVIVTYSPYHLLNSQTPGTNDSTSSYFVSRGYARAWVHLVGTGKSEGCYDYGGTRDIKTGAALVDWLGQRPWANGRVGMIGGSYDGTTQWAAAIDKPKHLATIVPQVAIDRWYDYAHYNGVRTMSGFGGTPNAFTAAFNFGIPDGSSGQSIIDSVQPCENLQHNVKAYENDPVHDGFWDERDYTGRAKNIAVSVMIEGSWADGNVLPHNSVRMWRVLPRNVERRFVMALQGHGASNIVDAADIRHAWFDRWLYGLNTGVEKLPATDSVDAGTRERRQDSAWPPPQTRTAEMRLIAGNAAHGALALRGALPLWTDTNPRQSEADVMNGAVGSQGIVFTGAPVAESVRIVDEPRVTLPIRTDKESTHVHAVLFDEAPDGSRRSIVRGAVNSRMRASDRESAPLAPGETWTADFGLIPTDWVLAKGHRLGVAIMSNNTVFSPYGDETRALNEVLLDRGPRLYVKAAENAGSLGPLLPEPPAPAGAPRAARPQEPPLLGGPPPNVARSADAPPFRFSFAADRRRLRRALPGGFRARAKCSLPCTVRAVVKDRRGRVLAEGKLAKQGAGRRTFTVRFSAKALRALRGRRCVRVTLAGVARAGSAIRTVRRAETLR